MADPNSNSGKSIILNRLKLSFAKSQNGLKRGPFSWTEPLK